MRATQIAEIADRHGLNPLLIVATNMYECDWRETEVKASVSIGSGKAKRIIGMDACPMGVRVVGPAAQRTYDAVELYEIAAARMEHWKRWCERGHRGNKPIALFHSPHHFMAHYNQGNPIYAHQVLGLLAVLDRRTISASDEALFTERTKETVRRLVRAFKARRA